MKAKHLLLLLASLTLSNCSFSSLVDAAIDRNQEKNDVRRHLRHGDSIREAQQGAHEDQFFRWAAESQMEMEMEMD